MGEGPLEPSKPAPAEPARRPSPKARIGGAALLFFVPAIFSILFQIVTRIGGVGQSNDTPDPALGVLPDQEAGFGCSGPRRSRTIQSNRNRGGGCGSTLFQRASDARDSSDDPETEDLPIVANPSATHRPPTGRAEPSSLAPPSPAAPSLPAPEQGHASEEAQVISLVEGYYRDLNAGTLDASKYFAPHIDRYISMMGTNPAAINQYIHGLFKKQFNSPKFEYETGSLEREADGSYVFAEHSSYYWVAKKRQVDQRYKVRVRLENGKLTFFQQFQKLPSER